MNAPESALVGDRPQPRPPNMKAAVYRRFGPPEEVHVEEVRVPAVGPGDVLVRVRASTVSVADHRARSHTFPRGLWALGSLGVGLFRPRRRVLGMDIAGVVETVGSGVTRFRPGDEVIAMLGGRFGGHAEYALVPECGAIAVKPRNLVFEEAVTLVFGGITARGFLNQVTLEPGATVLVNGASGAVGTAAVQLAKHLGAHVTGVSSSANHKLVSSLGADRVIDYNATDFATDGTTYDVIIDAVGNAPFVRVKDAIRPGGALLQVVLDLRGLLRTATGRRSSGKLVTANVGAYRAEDLAHLVGLAESGHYRAVIDRTFDLADVVEAHRYVDTGRKRGNVVLTLTDPRPHGS